MSHVKSSIIRKIEEYVRKVVFIDSSPLFDYVLDLSGPTTPVRRSRVELFLSKVVGFIINLSQYFSIAEFDVKKYGVRLAEYLEALRGSLETSITISSLLAGILTTIVMLVIVVISGVS